MYFKIKNVRKDGSSLVVTAEHYNPDGTFWFVENYIWQGREGNKSKRVVDVEGFLLLDNGSRVSQEDEAELPPGRSYQRHPGPHMDEDSILGIIKQIHNARLISGWPQGTQDAVRTPPGTQNDHAGINKLVQKFKGLKGHTV